MYKTPPLLVSDDNVTVLEAFKVDVETPVAPVIAPVPEMMIDGEERILV